MSHNNAERQQDEILAEVTRQFPERLTAAVKGTIDHPGDPVARQYLPDIRELDVRPEERADPIGDHVHSPVKGIVHRHTGRVLFKVASACAVNCRFCFRRMMLGTPEETLSASEIDAALDYIEGHSEINEVILTGGDPLILSQRRLAALLERLDKITHISVIRIHTRTPVADPARMTAEYCALFDRKKPVYIVLHVNHPQELSPDAETTLVRLHKSGAVLLSQSVLLKDVNDNIDALETLFRRLVALRVKPYYLHHPDLVPGTAHFRVPIETGQQLMRDLRRRASGLCLPTYVLDIPGGYGKVPLENAYIKKLVRGYAVTDHDGRTHIYS